MEQIDQLRMLLGAEERSVVTLTSLVGIRGVTALGDSCRRFEESGDVAFVILGPKEKVNGQRIERDDGTIIYSFTLNPE
jgi:hypothetical protein